MALELLDGPPLPGSWGRVMVNDLNVRSGPEDDSPVIGTLDDGALVRVIEGPAPRLQVVADGIAGWVSHGEADDWWVRLIKTPLDWTELAGVAAGPGGFLAFGQFAQLQAYPYEGGFEQSLIMASTDGATWSESHGDIPGSVLDAAAGPNGWVAVSYHGYGGARAHWSADGASWEHLTGFDAANLSVAHADAGFVVVGGHEDGIAAWRSSDGGTWAGPVIVPGTGSTPLIEASGRAYVVFDRNGRALSISPDGRIWRTIEIEIGEAAWIADVEIVGDTVLVLAVDPDTGGAQLYRAPISDAVSVETYESLSTDGFGGDRVDTIASGADGLLAFGWDPDALVPKFWRSTDSGTTWRDLDVAPDALGGMVGPEPEWAAGSWVALGQGQRGMSLWRSTDGRTWTEVAEPERLDLGAPPCVAAEEASTIVLMFLGDRALDCFGDRSLKIRGWVPLIEGIGGCCWAEPEPAWLAGPYPANWLNAGEVDHMGLELYAPEGVGADSLTTHRWVEVVGHYGDDAAETCRHTPVAGLGQRLESLVTVRDTCARRFVVESVTPVDGPWTEGR